MRMLPTCLAVTMLVAVACGPRDLVSTNTPILATYDGGEVTQEEYESWLRCHRKDHEDDRLAERLELIALGEVLSARASARGAEQEPAVRLRLDRAEQQQLLQALQDQEATQISFTDEEARAAFKANPDNLFRPRRLRLRNIFKRAPEEPGAEREQVRIAMQEIRRELLAGADFAEMARHESESQTRFNGGNLGFKEPSELRPEVAEAVSELVPGQLSEVIETEEGFTIILCWGEQEARTGTFEESSETVHRILEHRELKRRMTELEGELLADAAPEYDLAAARTATAPDTVVARYAGGSLSLAELEALLAGRRPGAPPRSEMSPEALRRVIDRHIFETLAAGRARELGLADDPLLSERIAWRQREALALAEITAEVNRRLQPISNEELQAELAAHPGRYRHPSACRLSVIRMTMQRSTMREEYHRAETLAAELRAGKRSFAEAARAVSDHPSAADGGALGWVSQVKLLGFGNELVQTSNALQPGETSLPVQLQLQLWIVRLEERRPARPMSFTEARDQLELRLGNQRVRELQQQVETELRAQLALQVVR